MGIKEAPEPYTKDFKTLTRLVILNSMGFFFLEFLIPYFASQVLNATGVQIGLIFSVHTIGFLTSSTFTGFITDRVKKKTRLILLGSFGRGSAYVIIYTAIILNSLIGLGIGTFSLGFMAGFFWIPYDTLIAQKSHQDNRSNAYGKRDSAIGKGMFVGTTLGFSIFGWSIGYFPDNPFIIYLAILIFGFTNFYAGIQYIRKIDESLKIKSNESNQEILISEESSKDKSQLKFSKPMLIGLIFLLTTLLMSSINGSLAKPFLNVYLLEEIESDPTIVILAYIPSGIIAMFLAPKLGKLVDKIHPAIGISVASVIGSITTYFLISTNNLWIFAILLIFDTIILNTAGLVIQNLLSRISLSHRGKVLGLNRLFSSFGYILGPVFGGFAWDYLGFKAPFIISIFIELCLIPFYVIAVFFIKPHLSEKYKKDIELHTEVI